jgi:glycosyltransferase involved in cell wall biosynthesis
MSYELIMTISQNKTIQSKVSYELLVSVIIIFLNEEKFIQEAIESVLSQTYEHWELLLVDDGSTDRSTEIARWYAEKYQSKVRYLEHGGHDNLGMSASRNLGVRHAKGTHIAYLDGDDVWLPNKLERQVAILESQPEAVIVCAPLQSWYSWTGNTEDMHCDALYGVGSSGVHPYGDTLVRPPVLLNLFLRDERFIPSSVLVQRDVIESVGGYEDVFHDGYSDAVVFVKICLTSTVFVSNECLYKYRKHSESYTYRSWHAGEDPAIRQFYLNWVKQYLLEQGVKDPEVWQALKDALWVHHHPRLHRIKEKILRLGQRILPVPVGRWLITKWEGCKIFLPKRKMG